MKTFVVMAVAVTLSACSSPPVIGVGADPSDPSASVPRLRYIPVTAGTVDFRPADPKPWIERNDSVAPKKEGQ